MSRDIELDPTPSCLRTMNDGAPCGNSTPCPIHQADAYCDVPSGALGLPCGAARPCAVHAPRFASGGYVPRPERVVLTPTDDPELIAVSRIVSALDLLDAAARRRIVAYVIERYGPAAPPPVGWYLDRDGVAVPVADLIVQRDTLGEALARTQLDQVHLDARIERTEARLASSQRRRIELANETRRLKIKLDQASAELATALGERDKAIARHATAGRERDEVLAELRDAQERLGRTERSLDRVREQLLLALRERDEARAALREPETRSTRRDQM